MGLDPKFSVADPGDLSVLQQAILEARFFSGARTRLLPGSPLLAELHQRCVDAIREQYEADENQRSLRELEHWLKWRGRDAERESLTRTLREMNGFSSWDTHRQIEVARSLVVPFDATIDEIEELVASAMETE